MKKTQLHGVVVTIHLSCLFLLACKNTTSRYETFASKRDQARKSVRLPAALVYNSKLSATDFTASMEKSVIRYPKEPFYYLFVSNRDCFYEILVNDFPVFKYYKEGQMITPIDLNWAINKSGKQKLTYKLYPLDVSGKGNQKAVFQAFTQFNLEVFRRDKANKRDPFSTEVKVVEHRNLNNNDGKSFINEGQHYYEYTIFFNAEVPYTNDGWEHSKDLRKIDQRELLSKTIKAYKEVWHLLDDHKIDQYFGLLAVKEREILQSVYAEREDVELTKQSYNDPFTIKGYKMQPLEHYKMVLYGDGKLVCLELNSLESKERGKSALWAKFDENGGVTSEFRKLYFHIPQGKTQFEVIR